MNKAKKQSWPQVVNLLWLTFPSALLWSTILCYIWLNVFKMPADEYVADYRFTVYTVGICCVFETVMEPVFTFSSAFLYMKLRLCVDLTVLLVRMALLAIIVLYFPSQTINSFAYGQVFSSVTYVAVYWLFFWNEFRKKALLMKNREQHRDDPLLALPFDSVRDFLPRRLEGERFIDPDMMSLNWGFFKQGILKQVLAEGGTYVMTATSNLTFTEQGVYNLVNSLGSGSARFLLMPITESSYFYFAQMTDRKIPIEQRPRKEVEQVAAVMKRLLRSLTLLGLIMIVFGFSYAHFVLLKYGGDSLVDGSGSGILQLRMHCIAVLVMAIIGVMESFAFAAMTPEELNQHNRRMVVLSIAYLGVTWLLSRIFGGVGLILANIIKDGLRIKQSLQFIRGYFEKLNLSPLSGLIPFKPEMVAMFLASAVTATSMWLIYPTSAMLHVQIGVVSWLAVVATILYCDTQLTSLIAGKLKKRS